MERYTLVDDLTGQEDGVKTHTFTTIDGEVREIDLTDESVEILREAMARFVAVSRPCEVKSVAPPVINRVVQKKRPAHNDPEQLKKVREWAWARGMEVSKYGRVPQEIWDAYQKLAGRNVAQESAASGGRTLFSAAATG